MFLALPGPFHRPYETDFEDELDACIGPGDMSCFWPVDVMFASSSNVDAGTNELLSILLT